MAHFSYKARAREGGVVEGVIEAPDRSAAIFKVEQEHGVPIRVQDAGSGSGRPAKGGNGAKPARAETAHEAGARTTLSTAGQFLLTEQLAHLLSAGMTLDEALAILERRMQQPKLKAVANSLHRSLIDGQSLSSAMRAFPRIFSPLYVNMVAAGEASGALPEILRRLTSHLAAVKDLRDRVQQALIYPSVLFLAGVLLIIIFMTVMVPQLTGFFTETGQELPAATRLLLTANHMIVHYWWAAVLAGLAIYGVFKTATRSEEGRRRWDQFKLAIPGYGSLTRYRFYAQFARTLGTLMQNGVTLLRSLELLEESSGNEYIRHQLIDVRKAVIDGAGLSNAMRGHQIVPELFIDMMAVGEQTGRFPETMHMVADVYERELDKQVKVTSALIPPLIMVLIASVVGLVIFGILSAVFNLTSGLQDRVS